MTQPGYPTPDPLPPPPTPAAVIAAHQRRYDAAVELIRAGDDLRELAKLGRSTSEDKWRHDEASKAWDRANGRRWPR